MAKILVCDPISEEGLNLLRKGGHQVIEQGDVSLSDAISDVDAIVVRSKTKVTSDVLKKAPNLKVIARAGAGLDNIDTEFAKKQNITVINSPKALTNAVAELVLGLMLSLSRHLHIASSSMKNKEWKKKELNGYEISGKTVGIVGFGAIGRRVADICLAFGANIAAFDVIDIPKEYLDKGIKKATLDDLLHSSDIITLHVPLLESTKGMIGSEQMQKMKDSAFLINASRGGIVDLSALTEALKNGKLRGAALDVYDQEPPGGDITDLILLSNVFPTPHIGAQTHEAQNNAAIDVAKKLLELLK